MCAAREQPFRMGGQNKVRTQKRLILNSSFERGDTYIAFLLHNDIHLGHLKQFVMPFWAKRERGELREYAEGDHIE